MLDQMIDVLTWAERTSCEGRADLVSDQGATVSA